MFEIGKVNAAAPVHAEGRVTVEYTDGLTGRVKERVQGKNHVFPGGMMLGGLPYLLGYNSTSNPLAIYLSDYAGALDTEIPLIPGNIIGYGTVGSAASGKYLGVENTAARSLGVYSAGKFNYKRQWSWTPNQVPGEIKKIGLTPRLVRAERGNYNNVLFSPLPVTFSDGGNGICNYDDGLYTKFLNQQYALSAVLVNQYSFGSMAKTEITWGQLVTIDDYYSSAVSSGHSCWLIDPGTRDMHLFYIYLSSELSEGNRQYKLLHAWFDASLSQRKGQEATVIGPTIYQFGFWGKDMYNSVAPLGFISGGICYLPHCQDEATFSFCVFDPAAAAGGDIRDCFTKHADLLINNSYSAAAVQNVGYYHSVTISGGNVSVSFYGPSGISNMQYVYLFGRGSTRPYAVKPIIDPSSYFYSGPYGLIPRNIGGSSVLAAYYPSNVAGAAYCDSGELWCNFSDLTCYSLPADAPARQEGQGVSVTYEIAVGY